jgi:predicted metal-dependent hydrolase
MTRARFIDRRPIVLQLGEETICVPVRESGRARRTRIIVGPGRPLEVIAASGAAESDIVHFLHSQQRWIRDKLNWSREIASRPSRLGLDRAGVVHLFGEAFPVTTRRSGASRAAVLRDGVLVAPSGSNPAGAVERWYRREASRRTRALIAEHAVRLRVAPRSLAIRDPRTRWGSCSAAGAISISWRLVLAPQAMLEYVAVHELCHLIHANHSRMFWKLLDDAHPSWRGAAGWLREHGHELHGYQVGTALATAG